MANDPTVILSVELKENTQAFWDGTDPVVPLRQGALSTDTGILKIGDGIKRYHELPPFEVSMYVGKHAGQHSATGRDPITPTSINAANRVHQHSSSDITDLASTVIQMITQNTSSSANTIVVRTATGTIIASAPSSPNEVARLAEIQALYAALDSQTHDTSEIVNFDGAVRSIISANPSGFTTEARVSAMLAASSPGSASNADKLDGHDSTDFAMINESRQMTVHRTTMNDTTWNDTCYMAISDVRPKISFWKPSKGAMCIQMEDDCKLYTRDTNNHIARILTTDDSASIHQDAVNVANNAVATATHLSGHPISDYALKTDLNNINATTLQGHPASDFTTPSQVADLIAASNSGTTTGSLSSSGYTKLPNGLIMQWGTFTSGQGANDGSFTFPISFPTKCVGVWFSLLNGWWDPPVFFPAIAPSTLTNSGASMTWTGYNGVSVLGYPMGYFALGY